MLTMYTGTPGSGKSLHLVREILEWLRKGKHVIANFPLKFDEEEMTKGYADRFFYKLNADITVNSLLEHAIEYGYIENKKESQCLVVYDEAGGKYNSRNVGAADRTEWIDFFSQHRKLGFDFILSCQGEKMIDKQIRTMVETEIVHRKVNNFGLFFLLPFSLFVAIERWYVAKERVGSEFFRYKKKYGDKYDTMKLFEGFKMSPQLLEKIEARKRARLEGVEPEKAVINVSDSPVAEIFENENENEVA
ncbi:MAG: zonular occludens toxin domain-containing protein [Clostridia bacterium]|nr:zonular occludens toxin domain-containing protein [Clostridia bacterium]